MRSVSSRLSPRFQVTLPKPVREALALKAGDTVAYEIHDGHVVLRNAVPVDVNHLEALQVTLSEWASAEDAAAYDDL